MFHIKRNKYLTPILRHLLCSASIQLYFDYFCSTCSSQSFQKVEKNKIQASQNKCTRSCLQLNKMTHIPQQKKKKIETISCLPIKEVFSQCINSILFKHLNNQSPHCWNEVFVKATNSSSSLRNTTINVSKYSVKLAQVRMSYLLLVLFCGIKSQRKLKEQLA